VSIPGAWQARSAGEERARMLLDLDPVEELGLESENEVHYFLVGYVDAIFEHAPGVRQHFCDLLLEELCEEVARREDPRHARATVQLIEDIRTDWGARS
jgi:hypothetical protein